MDAEFVNTFVQKQKDLINDLISRVVMLETRCSIAESQVLSTREFETKLIDLQATSARKDEENEKTINSLKEDIKKIIGERDKFKNDLIELRKSVKQIGA